MSLLNYCDSFDLVLGAIYIIIIFVHHTSGMLIKPCKPQPQAHGDSVGVAYQAISICIVNQYRYS